MNIFSDVYLIIIFNDYLGFQWMEVLLFINLTILKFISCLYLALSKTHILGI